MSDQCHIQRLADFNTNAPMFAPHHYGQVWISTIGILCWIGGLAVAIHFYGFFEVFRVYIIPYLWYVVVYYKSTSMEFILTFLG